MSKSLYSEFPTNAHAHGYGLLKMQQLRDSCKTTLARDRAKVSEVISSSLKAAMRAQTNGENV